MASAVPTAAQISTEQRWQLARGLIGMMGLSPKGTDLLARSAVERTADTRYNKTLSQVQFDLGSELASTAPNGKRLQTLIDRHVATVGARERSIEERRLRDALSLSLADRKIYGRYMAAAGAEGRPEPVTVPISPHR